MLRWTIPFMAGQIPAVPGLTPIEDIGTGLRLVQAGFKGLTGIGAGAGNGKRFTFPRRGFSSNVPTLIGEEPKKIVYLSIPLHVNVATL